MYLKSIAVTDYSTGSQYTYSGTDGTWQSIRSSGGQVNSNGTPVDPVSTIAAPAQPSITAKNTAPLPFEGTHADSTSSFVTPSIYPWVGSATATLETAITSAAVTTTISGLPSGWTVNSSGKVVPPPNAASIQGPSYYLLVITLTGGLLIWI